MCYHDGSAFHSQLGRSVHQASSAAGTTTVRTVSTSVISRTTVEMAVMNCIVTNTSVRTGSLNVEIISVFLMVRIAGHYDLSEEEIRCIFYDI